MADTADTTKDGKVVNVTYSGSGADWNHSTNAEYTKAMHVRAIIWLPSGTGSCVINNGATNGASIVHWQSTAITDDKQIVFGYPGLHCKPYIDLTDCSFENLLNTKIIFILD